MDYNVVIIGGGTAGIAAAYALAQLNGDYKIALVEKQEILGGTAVNGLVYDWIQGINPPYFEKICYELGEKGWCTIYKRSKKNSALVLELCVNTEDLKYTWLGRRFYEDAAEGNFSNDEGHIFFEPWKLAEKYESDLRNCGKIDILKGFSFCSADSIDGNVKEIVIKSSEEVRHITADFFIDCSADGVLCRYVNGKEGTDYYIGLDRRELYDEDILIENDSSYDSYKMDALIAPSLFFEIAPEDKVENDLRSTEREAFDKKSVSAEGYAFKYVGSTSIRTCNPMGGLGISGKDVLEYADTEVLRQEFIERVPAYWELVKDKSWAKGWTPKMYAKMPGIRETYRIKCKKMLTLSDLEQNVFERLKTEEGEDIIAVGSHPVDTHNNYGMICADALSKFNTERLKPYGISYYSMVPEKLNNVWIACRAFGASHLAQASARINKVMAQLGWAAGNAARYCLEKQITTNDLTVDDVLCLRTEEYTAFDKQVERAQAALGK